MVRYKIEQPLGEDEPSVTLRLESDSHGGVTVWASCGGPAGDDSCVATFTPAGAIVLHSCLNPGLGFQLDSMMRIKLENE